MCLFTHFAAGALAGGLTGSIGWAAVAGFASHAVLDVLPHYDHPDWRLELGGGLAALGLLLVMPFASGAAVVGGIAGMLPDLENLFQKLGRLRRDQFLYPTHTGLLRHGRPLGRGNLAVQALIFAACFVALGLANPGAAVAAAAPAAERAAEFATELATAPATEPALAPVTAVMAQPVVRLVSQTAERTVLRVDFPVQQAPADWQTIAPEAVRYALPPVIDDLDDGIGGRLRLLAPQLRLTVAVPTRAQPQLTVTDVRWWREPTAGIDPAALVSCAAPAVFRTVPLAGCEVSLAAAGGVLAGLTIELRHPATSPFADRLQKARDGEPRTAPLQAPAGVLNGDLFTALATGASVQSAARARSAAKAEPLDPFAATGHWVTLGVPATGLYRLTGQQLSGYGVPVGDVDPAKLRLYRGGSLALEVDPEYPDSLQVDRTQLNEVAIAVVDGGDGEWNLDDEVRFYGVSTSTWRDRFEAGAEPLDHYDHPYADEAVYWLTWENDAATSPLPGAPRRVTAMAAPALGGEVVDTVRLREHFEQQYVDAPGVFADNWAWDTAIFSSRTEPFNLRTPVAGSAARFVVDVRGVYDVFSAGYQFTAKAWLNSGTDQADSTAITYSAQNDSLRLRISGETTALLAGTNTITVKNASVAQGTRRPLALDGFDVSYWTALSLDPSFGQLAFAHWGDQVAAPGTATDLRLAVPTGLQPVVWDVTRPDSALALAGTVETGRLVFGLVREPGQSRHFVATGPGNLLAVTSGSRVLPISLLDDDGDVDYVVVTASALSSAAEELGAFRRTMLPGVASPRTRVVTAEAIYNNFSGGQKDPFAVRNYLRRLYDLGGQRLGQVCLVGKASRDYRNYKDRVPLVDLYDLLPTVLRHYYPQFPVALNRQMPFASDDAFVSFDTPPSSAGSRADLDFPDLACGRLPAQNVSEARTMVERVIAYAETAEAGPWRNQVLLTADDVYRPSSGQTPVYGEDAHTREAEDLSNNYLPGSLDVNKIYGVDYPFPPSSQVKPACRAAINAALNAGTTMFYYVGHGAEDNLADEQIFQSRDIANLGNGARRPLFVAFSCDVGVYDSPTRLSMAEQFVAYASGGAAGSICASQVSWSTDNDAITEAFFRNLFPARHIDAGHSVGQALLAGKGQMGNLDYRANSQRYNLMGDPALLLPHPVDDLTLSEASLDTLQAGARQTVVLAVSGKAMVGAGDSYRLRVQESAANRTYPNTPAGGTGVWVEPGAPVFNGEGTVSSGDLVIPFKVPTQIQYGEQGRVRLVVESPDGDHVAVQTVPAIRGSVSGVDDVRGPAISLAFADGRYRVRPGDELIASLVDTSGIAILGTSPGNSLLLELDDSGRMTDVTASFAYAPNSYTNGSLAFPLPADLPAGSHLAALHASDALGNVGSDTLSFQIVPDSVIGIEDITLFPNPTSGPCRLLFELSDPMTVQWDIYTLSGRRLRSLTANFPEAGPRILEWDGRDARGDEIANGTYLFVLRGSGAAADGREITKTGKLVVMR